VLDLVEKFIKTISKNKNKKNIYILFKKIFKRKTLRMTTTNQHNNISSLFFNHHKFISL
jgi:hypothetical protein